MAENTTEAIQDNTPKPDWYLNKLSGTVSDNLDKINGRGLSMGDFEVRKSEDYWQLPEIKAMFENDKKAFDNDYIKSVESYNKLSMNQLLLDNYAAPGTAMDEWLGRRTPTPQVTRTAPDPWGRTYNSMKTLNGGMSDKKRGWRETAIQTGVKVGENDYVTAKDFNGHAKFALDGNGAMALNEDGNPYLVPVKENEELKGFEEIYNPASDWMGYYGHDYSIGQIAGSIPKNALNFVSNTLDALAEYPKAIAALGGHDNSDFYKDTVGFQNWAKSFRVGTTEEGQESFFSLENIIDLSQQVVYQLGSMVLTGGSVGALTGSAKAGSMAGRLFMVGIAAGDIAQRARDAGLSNKEAALVLGLTSAAFYPLMGLSEAAVGRLNLQNSRAAVNATVGDFINVLPKNSPAAFKGAFKNASANIKDLLYRSSVAAEGSGAAALATGAVTESIEEMSEQVIDLGVRNLYNYFNNNVDESSPVAQWLGTDKNNSFQMDWVAEAQAIGHSAFGGAIGGAVASKIFRRMHKNNPSLKRHMWDAVVDGKEKLIKNQVAQLAAEGRLDATWLNQDNGIVQNGEVNRNEAARNVVDGLVDWMVEMRDSQELKEIIPNNRQRLESLEMIFKNLDSDVEQSPDELMNMVQASLPNSSLGKDAADLSNDIIDIDQQIEEKLAADASDTDAISDLRDERDLKQERLRQIVSGRAVADYVSEGIYALNKLSRGDTDLLSRKLTGKQFVNLSKMYSPTMSSLQDNYDVELSEFNERNTNVNLDEAPASVSAEAKQGLVDEATTSYTDAIKGLRGKLTEEDEFDIDFFESQAGNTDISTERMNEVFADMILNNNLREDERFADVIKARADLAKARGLKIEEAPLEPVATQPLMTTVQRTQGRNSEIMMPTSTPIQNNVDEEVKLEKESVSNGVSTYTGTDRLGEIKDSIQIRRAQIKGLSEIEPITTPIYQRHGQDPLPKLSKDNAAGLLATLDAQEEIINNLIRIAKANETNREAIIRNVTLRKLEEEADLAGRLAEMTDGTEISGIRDIINAHLPAMYEAKANNDIDGFFSNQREMESKLFNGFNQNKAQIVGKLQPSVEATNFNVNSGRLDDDIKLLNYVHRVLSLKADDFWNALKVSVENTANDFPPSYEQVLVIKQAVQSAMGSAYSPEWLISAHPSALSYDSAVLVLGGGGTGKTSQVVPIVAHILQQFSTGKKIFATSKHLGEDNSKAENVANAISNYFNSGAVELNNSNKEIIDFIKSDEMEDTDVIVYDEATLLTDKELRTIREELQKINIKRYNAKRPLVKMVYSADLKQNSADIQTQLSVAKVGQDTPAKGFDDKAQHQINRTDELSFSFRSQNVPLKSATQYFSEIQSERGISEKIKFEYRNGKGVNVMNDYSAFTTHAANIIEKFAKSGRFADLVYITDKPRSELNSKITKYPELQILTPVESQGKEWGTVIVDLQADTPFADTNNLPIKRAYYTAVTRAEEYLVMNVNPSAGIKSSEGTVREFEPLVSEESNFENFSTSVENILGDSSGNGFNLRSQVRPSTQITEEPEETVDAEEGTIARDVQKIMEGLSDREWTTIYSFFTPEGPEGSLDKALWTKREALYRGSPDFTYNLVIAKNGSPEYTNIINRDPRKEGSYATFIEVDAGRGPDVLATLPSFNEETLKAVEDVVADNDLIRISLDPSVFSPMRAIGPRVLVKDLDDNRLPTVNYRTMRENSQPGMVYGTPRIITQAYKIGDKDSLRPGDIVVPVSFDNITPAQVDKEANRDTDIPAGITFVKMSTRGRMPMENFLADLNEKMYGPDGIYNEKTKKLNFQNKSFNQFYRSFWGHYTSQKINTEDGLVENNKIAQSFADILKNVDPNSEYGKFLRFYSDGHADYKGPESTSEKIKKSIVLGTEQKKKAARKKQQNSYWFMVHYTQHLNGKNLHNTIRDFNPALYQQAIADLSGLRDDSIEGNSGIFGDGLLFTPDRGPENQRGLSGWHMMASNMPTYQDEYLGKDGVMGMPQPQIKSSSLVNAIGLAATVNTESFASETGIITDGNTNYDSDLYDNTVQFFKDSSLTKNHTLLDFYTKWYNKRPERMVNAVNNFRRGLYNKIFDFQNGTIHSVDKAVREYKAEVKQAAGIASSSGVTIKNAMKLADESDEMAGMVDALAINESLDFLLDFYFPTIKFKDGKFGLGITNVKNKGFFETESISLLNEGMNEMITTQLLNTPVLDFKNNVYEVRKDGKGNTVYLSRDNIEDLINTANRAQDSAELIDTLRMSTDPIARSVYIRFFSPNATSVKVSDDVLAGSVNIRSLSQMSHPDAGKIATSIQAFIRSGDIFNLSSVNLDGDEFRYRGLPIGAFGRPNVVREEGFQGILTKAHTIANKVNTNNERVIIEGRTYYAPGKKLPTEADVLSGMEDIGLAMFGQNALEYLYTHPELINVRADTIEEQKQFALNYLMSDVIFPIAREIRNGDAANATKYINSLNQPVFAPIIASAGINHTIRQRNINGDMVERFRKSVPGMRVDDRIRQIREEGQTLHSDNLLVNGTYDIHTMFLKEGFKRFYRGQLRTKSARALTAEETADLDILYGFQQVITQTDGEFAAIPIQVYSDAPTDITAIVKTDKGFYRPPTEIYQDVFNARANYYRKLEAEIINRYNVAFDAEFKSLNEINETLKGKKISELEKLPGFVAGIMYDQRPNEKGQAQLKSDLISEIAYYKANNLNNFLKKQEDEVAKLKELSDNSLTSDKGISLTNRLVTKTMNGEEVLKAFHANWLAVSSQYLDLMVGSRFQYDAKKNTNKESGEYIDYVKRSQSEISSRHLFVHREDNWEATGDVQSENQLAEGKKLPKNIKVAFVHDIQEKVQLSTKDSQIDQDIYDGATFVSFLTRKMQSASLGENFGIGTPPVMKNVTSAYDPGLGVKTYVKHAEFLITPEILRNGTERVRAMHDKMLSEKFATPKEYNGEVVNSAMDILEKLGGVTIVEDAVFGTTLGDYSNITEGHFDELLDALVTLGEQDSPIMAILPGTSVKTGRGATNGIDANSWVTESLDITNTGVQLDASKEAGVEHTIKVLTQMINASVINWKDPVMVEQLLGSIAAYTETALQNHIDNPNFKAELRQWVNTGLNKSSNLSYQHILANKFKEYSFDNPQIIESVFITLGNVLSKGTVKGNRKDYGAAIMPLFNGNHYVVHPMAGLVQIIEVNRNGVIIPVLRDAVQEGDEIVAVRDRLKWNDPVKETDEGIITFTEALNEATTKAEKDALRAELDEGIWSAGEAEILLPADMQNSFFMKDLAEELGRPIQTTDVTVDYLATKLAERNIEKEGTKSEQEIMADAHLLYATYKMRLSGLTARIPSTGKHSAVNTTIVGFMHESANSIFVPIELLAVQGADQDIDKGEHLTYELKGNSIPMIDEDFDKMLSGDEYKALVAREGGVPVELMAESNVKFGTTLDNKLTGLKNRIVYAMRQIIGDPKNNQELNTTVDDALDELRGYAEEAKNALSLSRDDYTSMARMHADNQAGKQLVGVFANGLKAYQVIYGAARMDEIPSMNNIAGLFDESNQEWVKFAALINAATDNGNEQILGSLGINLDNANMVSFMVANGKSWDDILNFFSDTNRQKRLQGYYDSKRYDSNKRTYNVEAWQKDDPELYSVFKHGEEFSLLAQSIMNRSLPSGSYAMFNLRNKIEDFVVRNTNMSSFDYAKFTNPEESVYRETAVQMYEQAIANNPSALATNILFVLSRSPHISGYNAVYSFAESTMRQNSKIYTATSNIAKSLTEEAKDRGFMPERRFRDIMNFVYGSVVHEYLNAAKVKNYDFDLATWTGRTEFVKWVNSKWFTDMKRKYPANSFIESLYINEDMKYKHDDAQRMKTHGIFQMDEEIALQRKADFDKLTKQDRETLALYSLIVDKGRVSKNSFASFFDPTESHISRFNGFLNGKASINVGRAEYQRFEDAEDMDGLYHNAIPYGNTNELTQAEEEEKMQLARVSYGEPIENGFVDYFNAMIPIHANTLTYGARLDDEVKISTGGRPATVKVKDLPDYYLARPELHTAAGKTQMSKIKAIFDNVEQPTNEESDTRTEQCELPNGIVPS